MEIARVNDNSIRVKSKNASFIFNPDKKVEEVAIFTKKPTDYNQLSDQIVIDAPGEYEVSGVSIKVEKQGEGLAFEFFEEGQKLVVLSSASSISSSEVEDATAVVVFLTGGSGNEVSKIACDIVAVVGSEENLPQDRSNIQKADKINLRKAEEYKGFIVHLSK